MIEKNILESLNWRYAVKKFDATKKIDEKAAKTLFESLRLTPSSFGLQPWGFRVVESSKMKAMLRPVSWNQSQIEDAHYVVVLCRKKEFGEKDIEDFVSEMSEKRSSVRQDLEGYEQMMKSFINKFSSAELKEWMSRQVYIALGQLLSTAAFMGVDTCPIEGFQKEEYDKILDLHKENLESVVVCALGHRSSEDKYQHAAKVRFSEKELFSFS